MQKNKTVYVAMSADLIHVGHLNIINIASKYGKVTIGLLTDRAIASYKRVPIMEYKDRYKIISSIKGVHDVVPQVTLDYVPNLKKLKFILKKKFNSVDYYEQQEIKQIPKKNYIGAWKSVNDIQVKLGKNFLNFLNDIQIIINKFQRLDNNKTVKVVYLTRIWIAKKLNS